MSIMDTPTPQTSTQPPASGETPDEPSVMGGGCGRAPMPSRSEAEAVWRRAYVDRMVERGIDRESAQACSDAGDADLSVNPEDAADDELQYWADDDGQ